MQSSLDKDAFGDETIVLDFLARMNNLAEKVQAAELCVLSNSVTEQETLMQRYANVVTLYGFVRSYINALLRLPAAFVEGYTQEQVDTVVPFSARLTLNAEFGKMHNEIDDIMNCFKGSLPS